jgi:hypothetical protein
MRALQQGPFPAPAVAFVCDMLAYGLSIVLRVQICAERVDERCLYLFQWTGRTI